eukprot:15492-Chlamydomonas_euryale.AAC.2
MFWRVRAAPRWEAGCKGGQGWGSEARSMGGKVMFAEQAPDIVGHAYYAAGGGAVGDCRILCLVLVGRKVDFASNVQRVRAAGKGATRCLFFLGGGAVGDRSGLSTSTSSAGGPMGGLTMWALPPHGSRGGQGKGV